MHDLIVIQDVAIGYGHKIIQHGLSFNVHTGEIFVVMGPSGSGKSTLFKSLVGIHPPKHGHIYYNQRDFWHQNERHALLGKIGVVFQTNALWSNLTLAENIELPLKIYTTLSPSDMEEVINYKLSLVNLQKYGDYYPSQLSGGMQKRAALARSLALDPEILFLDEPTSGFDPIIAGQFEDLILQLKHIFHTTIVLITHELNTILHVADRAVFLDDELKTMTALGSAKELLQQHDNKKLHSFLNKYLDDVARHKTININNNN